MTTVPSQLGAYTIDREIGRGGMGVVYLGHDTNLDRAVAIKALPEHLASDPDRLARFEREARTLAQLNHPNVAGIYGVEEHQGSRYLVLEYVEGQTLAERLDRGPLEVDDALEVCVQIAAGVEAAHEAGVIHRDLKPANVKITPDGKVKVLDFGLAKADEGASSSGSGMSESPTLTTPAIQHSPTIPGAILGTAAYMSPEQARGRKLDKRTDIWSFGVVLYECLCGASPFVGETASDSIGAILHKDVDLARLPAAAPASVRHVIGRCLQRDKTLRYRDIGDAALDLQTAYVGATAVAAKSGLPASAMVAVLVIGGLLGAAGVWFGRDSSEPPAAVMRYEIDLEREGSLQLGRGSNFALSRDGARLAYIREQGDKLALNIRELDQAEGAVLVTGPEILHPFFSPDGRWVGYFTASSLMKIAVTGGSPIELVQVEPESRGGTWGPDGSIIYTPRTTAPLLRVSAQGGTTEAITTRELEASERSHRWPDFVPGRPDLVVFTSQTHYQNFDQSSIEILDLSTGKRHVLHVGGSYGRVTAEGSLVFMQRGTLYAALLADDRLSTTSAPTPVLYNVTTSTGNGGAQVSFSDTGDMIYVEGDLIDSAHRMPMWIDFDGNQTPALPEPAPLGSVRISPDGTQLAYQESFANQRIVVHELRRAVATPLSAHEYVQMAPIWSPDGKQIVFTTRSEEHFVPSLFMVTVGSDEAPVRLSKAGVMEQFATSWSPDGTKILFEEPREGTQVDVLVYDVESGQTTPFVATSVDDKQGKFSPDGDWVAFVSDVSGMNEVYIKRFDGSSTRQQASIGGGIEPIWHPDGSMIYYLWRSEDGDYTLWSVGLEATDDSMTIATPKKVMGLELVENQWGRRYDIDPSGERFLVLRDPDRAPETSSARTHLVLNWFTDLERELAASAAP